MIFTVVYKLGRGLTFHNQAVTMHRERRKMGILNTKKQGKNN